MGAWLLSLVRDMGDSLVQGIRAIGSMTQHGTPIDLHHGLCYIFPLFPIDLFPSFQSQSTHIHTIQRPLTLPSLPECRRVINSRAPSAHRLSLPHTQLPHRQQSNCRPSTQRPTTTIPVLAHSPWAPDANTTSHRHAHQRADQPRCLAEPSTSSIPPQHHLPARPRR